MLNTRCMKHREPQASWHVATEGHEAPKFVLCPKNIPRLPPPKMRLAIWLVKQRNFAKSWPSLHSSDTLRISIQCSMSINYKFYLYLYKLYFLFALCILCCNLGLALSAFSLWSAAVPSSDVGGSIQIFAVITVIVILPQNATKCVWGQPL